MAPNPGSQAASGPKRTSRAGRPQSKFATEHFERGEKLSNSSGRYFWFCKYCDDTYSRPIEGRDNGLARHIGNIQQCPNATQDARVAAQKELLQKGKMSMDIIGKPLLGQAADECDTDPDQVSGQVTASFSNQKKRKKLTDNLDYWVDPGMTESQVVDSHTKWFRFAVRKNIALSASEDPFFHEFVHSLRATYQSPSRYVLAHTIMDAEAMRAHLEEMGRLKEGKTVTLQTDGWEDLLRRSIYGTIVSSVGQLPVVLSLTDLSGQRASADNILKTVEDSMVKMELPPEHVIACTTDNPTVMRSFRQKLMNKYYWILGFPCFLHGCNGIVGKMVSYLTAKAMISSSARIVAFFNSSHYWGGQLKALAAQIGITRSLKTNIESRWYALVLQNLSIRDNRSALTQICTREDAQKKTNGLSPIPPEVIKIVLDVNYWSVQRQILKVCKPVVDMIGNLESRDATLADCMLDLIRCARSMGKMEFEQDSEDFGFWLHSRRVFNKEFHAMDTETHGLALFLHPLCRKLAIYQAGKGRTFETMCHLACNIAVSKWRWDIGRTGRLVDDLKLYRHAKGDFVGGKANTREWWDSLDVNMNEHPLKLFAIKIHSIVPHSADVERLFSDLGSIQGAKRSNLTIENFEKLGKLRANYQHHLHKLAHSLGTSTRRKHAHMHTREDGGINLALAAELEMTFTWEPPLLTNESGTDPGLVTPEDVSLQELEAAFSGIEDRMSDSDNLIDPTLSEDFDGGGITAATLYDLDLLDQIDKGMTPANENSNIIVLDGASEPSSWSVEDLLRSKGVSA